MKKSTAKWFNENGQAIYTIYDKDKEFVGTAICSPKDKDMESSKTGMQIASMRAQIKYLIHLRDNELKPQLKILNQLYYSMNRSKKFNEKSYENIMLQRQINLITHDLNTVSNLIQDTKNELKTYIEYKDIFYKKIRNNRNRDKEN